MNYVVPFTIGYVIREARSRLGMNQGELARAIGVSTTSVCAWERNRSTPQQEHADKLVEVLNLPSGKMNTIGQRPKKGANAYQQAALRTAFTMNQELPMLLNGALGLCGEAGEFADLVKKAMFQGHALDREHMAKELGDVAWYLAVSAHEIGYDLETILRMNVYKLRERYPDGFDASRSINREENDK